MNSSKLVLITGASSGFGKEITKALLSRGHRVIATMRKVSDREKSLREELKPASAAQLDCQEFDITQAEGRAKIAAHIQNQYDGKLDCLINNAGYGLFGALEDLSEEGLRKQMETNFFGLAFTTQALLPALRSARGKLINFSSILGVSAMPLTGAYCASKFAVEGLSESLAYELAPHGVQVCIIEPGAFKTSFGSNVLWGARSMDKQSPYASETGNYMKFKQKLSEKTQPHLVSSVGEKILNLVEAQSMPLRVRLGSDARSLYLARRFLPSAAFTKMNRSFFKKALYQESAK